MSNRAHHFDPAKRLRRAEEPRTIGRVGYAGTPEAIDKGLDELRRSVALAAGPNRIGDVRTHVYLAHVGIKVLELIPGLGDDELRHRLELNPIGFLIHATCKVRP